MAYTIEEKATAIAIVQRFGGMTQEALESINDALGRKVSTYTVHSWLSKTKTETKKPKNQNQKKETAPTAEMIHEADLALDDVFEGVARKYLTHASKDSVVLDTKGKDAVIAAATAVDKMRLLRGLPTEIVQVLPILVSALENAGLSAAEVFNAMLTRLNVDAHHK